MNHNIKNILITGGAGFIGSHLADSLIAKGYHVRVLDNLDKQVHPRGTIPSYLNKKIEFIRGDVTNKKDIIRSLENIDALYHFAAKVGVGQSMYEIERYVKVNSYGTALLLDVIVNGKYNLQKIIVAASMSSYGEGIYRCRKCGIIKPTLRSHQQLLKKEWEVKCPNCQNNLLPLPTPENAPQNTNSIYAIGKNNQEEMVMNVGWVYKIPVVALRFFNVYGPRQSLSNPYTGVAAIFMSRIKNNHPPLINEDGLQTRDFIHVSDIVQANIASLEDHRADYQVFNVGTGKPISVMAIAELLIKLYQSKVKPEISQKFRKMDIRHCYADITKIRTFLDWQPKVKLQEGLKELLAWSEGEDAIDNVENAMKELEVRGLR